MTDSPILPADLFLEEPPAVLEGAVPLPASARFRRERERDWQALGEITVQHRRGGWGALDLTQIGQLPTLYRSALSALSVARAVSLDRLVVRFLEDLSLSAFVLVHGREISRRKAAWQFLSQEFPRAMRGAWPWLLLSLMLLFSGIAAGWIAVAGDPAMYAALTPDFLAEDRVGASPDELRQTLYDDGGGDLALMLASFGSYLFVHNVTVGLLSFGAGIAIGLPTLVLVAYNGIILGAFLGHYDRAGLGLDAIAWLSIHGTTEFLALTIFAASGLILGAAIARPGRLTRAAALRQAGPRVAVLIAGGALLLLVAALLEAVFRQAVQDLTWRLRIGYGLLALWLLVILAGGRRSLPEQRP